MRKGWNNNTRRGALDEADDWSRNAAPPSVLLIEGSLQFWGKHSLRWNLNLGSILICLQVVGMALSRHVMGSCRVQDRRQADSRVSVQPMLEPLDRVEWRSLWGCSSNRINETLTTSFAGSLLSALCFEQVYLRELSFVPKPRDLSVNSAGAL